MKPKRVDGCRDALYNLDHAHPERIGNGGSGADN